MTAKKKYTKYLVFIIKKTTFMLLQISTAMLTLQERTTQPSAKPINTMMKKYAHIKGNKEINVTNYHEELKFHCSINSSLT